MTAKPTVLGVGPIFGTKNWERVGRVTEQLRFPDGTREEFLANLDRGEYNGIFGIFRTMDSTRVTGPFDSELVAKLPASVKFLCHCGAGYDNIDVQACTKRGIQVSNTPHVNDKAVADMAIFLMIGALRRADTWYAHLRAGEWYGPSPTMGHDPEDKVMGIIGMGTIGQDIAARARGFEMRIQYHNRSRLPPEKEGGATYVDLDTLLATSDVVVLSLLYTPESYHLLGAPQFAKMKKGATVVNIARGKMIDEAALLAALDDGTVWGAGLDVFETEPTANAQLLKDNRVFLSPHMGAATMETYLRMENLAMQNLEAAVTTGRQLNLVPEQKGIAF